MLGFLRPLFRIWHARQTAKARRTHYFTTNDAMRQKDHALFEMVRFLPIMSALAAWRKKYPDDFTMPAVLRWESRNGA